MNKWQSSTQLSNGQQQHFSLDQELGKGGEAVVWTIRNHPDLVAKLYHRPTSQHQNKVTAMLISPPDSSGGHMTIVWPTSLLFHQRRFAGFLMPRLDSDSQPVFKFYNAVARQKISPNFNWKYLHRTAMNLAIAIDAVHAKGHLIGDINESNILVNDRALVTVVDTDSFQIREPTNHQIYRCRVGKPEYTAPELQGVDFKTVIRQESHDLFGLGVLIFQLLMDGFHPFSGVLHSSASVGRVDLYCIQQGMFPYQKNSWVSPNPNAPSFDNLHPDLRTAFLRCFVQGYQNPTLRPTAQDWQIVLQTAESELVTCPRNQNHIYSGHLTECPQCTAPKNSLSPTIQKPLPSIKKTSAPTSTTPQKRWTGMQKLILGGLATILLLVLVMICFVVQSFFAFPSSSAATTTQLGNNEEKSASFPLPTAKPPTSTATPTPLTPTVTPTPLIPTATPTLSPPPTLPPTATLIPSLIGHEYQTKHFIFSVIGSPTRMKAIRGEYREEEAEGVFLIVPVRWRNTSQISRYNFIHGPNTCIVTPRPTYWVCEPDDVFGKSAFYDTQGLYFSQDTNLAPGEVIDGWLVYDIPEDLSPVTLTICFDNSSSCDIVAQGIIE